MLPRWRNGEAARRAPGGAIFVHAEAAVGDAEGLEGVEGDAVQSRQRVEW